MTSKILAAHTVAIDNQQIYAIELHRFPIGDATYYKVRTWRYYTPDWLMETVAITDGDKARAQFDRICQVFDAEEAPL